MKNKWKTAFFLCLAIWIGTLLSGTYFLALTGGGLNHSRYMFDHLDDDVELTSMFFNEKLRTFEEIKMRLNQLPEAGWSSYDSSKIQLNYVELSFDENGQWTGIGRDRGGDSVKN